MNLTSDPWIPTLQGEVSIQQLLEQPDRYTEIDSGNILTDAALLRLLILLNARGLNRLPADLNLFGEQPFMQVPPAYTQELPLSPIHSIDVRLPTGSDSTHLGHHFDNRPTPLTPAQAARILVTFHAFAMSRGKRTWSYSSDTPNARTTQFQAIGRTLAETLDLNTPPGMNNATVPTWEQAPNWNDWRAGTTHPTDVNTTYAHPWWTITLQQDTDGLIRWIRTNSGVKPDDQNTTWPDPNVLTLLTKVTGEAQPVPLRFRNPPTREMYIPLLHALSATFSGSDLAPLAFRNARERGARFARACGSITTTGTPTVQNIAEANLPWPSVPDETVLELINVTLDLHEKMLTATANLLTPITDGRRPSSKAGEDKKSLRYSTLPLTFWKRIWPHLTQALTGEITAGQYIHQVTDTARTTATERVSGGAAYIEKVVTP